MHKLIVLHIYLGDGIEALDAVQITQEKREELLLAIRNGNTDRIKKIELEFPGVVNQKDKNGRPIIFEAIDRDQLSSFICMVELGADIEATDEFLRKPLHIAAMQRRRTIAEYLMKRKAKPSKDKTMLANGTTAHHRPSYWAGRSGDKTLALMLRRHESTMSKEKVEQRTKSTL